MRGLAVTDGRQPGAPQDGPDDHVVLPDHDHHSPAGGRTGLHRRGFLLAAAAVTVSGAAAATVWQSTRVSQPSAQAPSLEPSPATSSAPPSVEPSDRPTTEAQPGEVDETADLQALLDTGGETVVIPTGTHVISATLLVPWQVRTLQLEDGAVLYMRGDEIAVRRNGEIDERARGITRAVEGEDTVDMDSDGLAVGGWVYLCADDWVKVGKSKVGMLRRVTAVAGRTVTVDKPLIRTLTDNPRGHAITLAPGLAITGNGVIENAAPTETKSNLVRFDFVDGIELRGLELRNCGTAAVRTYATVGGVVDCWIHDCVDNPNKGQYGYGVSVTSATRDLQVLGTIERVRHAFTTDHGYDPLISDIAQTGEPEDIYVAPVVRDTTSTGIDTHEPGYGITIVPDVSGSGTTRWGGVNIRARKVTIQGGRVLDSNEWGILVSPSAADTVLRDVEVSGVLSGRGIDCRSNTTVEGCTVSDFGKSFGLDVKPEVVVAMSGTTIDGLGQQGARGIGLASSGCTLDGVVKGCSIGVLTLPEAGENQIGLTYEDVGREVVDAGA